MCKSFEHPLTDLQIEFGIMMIDRDGSGTLSYDEFLKWWQQKDRFQTVDITQEKLQKLHGYLTIFKSFDTDGNGILDKQEYTFLHKELTKKNLTRHSFEEFVADIDQNGDENLSFNEFAEWLLRKEV
jgi:Ca2+-binding EF-hand superfamily protein